MIVGIDASNIRAGGGVVHFIGILNNVPFDDCKIARIVVWGRPEVLACVPAQERIRKLPLPETADTLLRRFLWQQKNLRAEASALGCDILLVPGGVYLGGFRPFVSMVQNMQVFEWSELKREGLSKEVARLLLLQLLQAWTCLRSSGVIFLSNHCLKYFKRHWKPLIAGTKTIVIPHGIDHLGYKRAHKPIQAYSGTNPLRILYVSTVKMYKHQWKLVDAVGKLRERNYPLHLHLVGEGDRSAVERLQRAIKRNERGDQFVFYHGHQTYQATRRFFDEADVFAFPSTCETFGISLLEAMSHGLPIACSTYGPMPEVLGNAGLFFDPLDSDSIAATLEKLILDRELRRDLSAAAQERARQYSWQICARDTFAFLHKVWKEA